MARSATFFALFLATHASLLLLYPFTLSRFLLTASIYGAGTLIMLYLLFHPRNQWLVTNRSRVEGERSVALTFDDGPDPVDTPKLLDLLREKNVKATFFVVGQARRPVSGSRAPRLGGRPPDRQPHLVASSSILFSHALAPAGRDRARHGKRAPHLWFPSAIVSLASRSASPASAALSQGRGIGVRFLDDSHPRHVRQRIPAFWPSAS